MTCCSHIVEWPSFEYTKESAHAISYTMELCCSMTYIHDHPVHSFRGLFCKSHIRICRDCCALQFGLDPVWKVPGSISYLWYFLTSLSKATRLEVIRCTAGTILIEEAKTKQLIECIERPNDLSRCCGALWCSGCAGQENASL